MLRKLKKTAGSYWYRIAGYRLEALWFRMTDHSEGTLRIQKALIVAFLAVVALNMDWLSQDKMNALLLVGGVGSLYLAGRGLKALRTRGYNNVVQQQLKLRKQSRVRTIVE